MITEDYVSFETAKLLREKGFDEKCRAVYEEKILRINTLCDYLNSELSSYVCAPTLQMACKWLREEKNLCIYVFPHKDGYEYGKWEAGICYCDDAIDATINACGHIFGETYEEAVEAALKYTLENLI